MVGVREEASSVDFHDNHFELQFSTRYVIPPTVP